MAKRFEFEVGISSSTPGPPMYCNAFDIPPFLFFSYSCPMDTSYVEQEKMKMTNALHRLLQTTWKQDLD